MVYSTSWSGNICHLIFFPVLFSPLIQPSAISLVSHARVNVCLHFFSFFRSALLYIFFKHPLMRLVWKVRLKHTDSFFLLTMVMSMSLSEFRLSVSVTVIGVWMRALGGAEDGWCCVQCAIHLNKHQSGNRDRDSRLRRSALTSPCVIMNWCWISARSLSINHIPLLRKTGLARDQLAGVKPIRYGVFFTWPSAELSHPPQSDNRLIYGSKGKIRSTWSVFTYLALVACFYGL